MQRTYQLISQYPNISAYTIARLYNVKGNKITIEIVNKAEPGNLEDIENHISELLKNNRIVQGVGGFPRRYKTTDIPDRDDDDEDDYVEEARGPTSEFRSQHEMREIRDTHVINNGGDDDFYKKLNEEHYGDWNDMNDGNEELDDE